MICLGFFSCIPQYVANDFHSLYLIIPHLIIIISHSFQCQFIWKLRHDFVTTLKSG